MPTIKETYLGDLRVECVHCATGTTIVTDAPLDNQGKGEAFSPTDLCATALGTCALTIMGIYARNHGLDITGATVEINKIMNPDPRRIGRLEVTFNMPPRQYSDREKAALINAVNTCPVHLSLHPEIEQVFTYNWAE
jgi:uncharacterized OsmC-like protein